MTSVNITLPAFHYSLAFQRDLLQTFHAETSILSQALELESDVGEIQITQPCVTPKVLHILRALIEKGTKPYTSDPILKTAGDYLGIPILDYFGEPGQLLELISPEHKYSRLYRHKALKAIGMSLPPWAGYLETKAPPQALNILADWAETGTFTQPHEPTLARLHDAIPHPLFNIVAAPIFDAFRKAFPEVVLWQPATFQAASTAGEVLRWAVQQNESAELIHYLLRELPLGDFTCDQDYNRMRECRRAARESIRYKNYPAFKVFYEQGVFATEDLNPALLDASASGQTLIVKRLLENPHTSPSANHNAALKAANKGYHREIVNLLKRDARFIRD